MSAREVSNGSWRGSHFTIVVIVAILGACQFSENRFARREVSREELVGTWKATNFAIKSLRDVGLSPDEISQEQRMVLMADGTCTVKTVFGLPGDVSESEYRVYDTGCFWSVAERQYQVLELHLSPPPKSGSPYFYFAEESQGLVIWQYASDPDSWRYLEFEKFDG